MDEKDKFELLHKMKTSRLQWQTAPYSLASEGQYVDVDGVRYLIRKSVFSDGYKITRNGSNWGYCATMALAKECVENMARNNNV